MHLIKIAAMKIFDLITMTMNILNAANFNEWRFVFIILKI